MYIQIKRIGGASWGMNSQYVSDLDNKEKENRLVTLDKISVSMYNLLGDIAWLRLY